jgi:hypothetical protein
MILVLIRRYSYIKSTNAQCAWCVSCGVQFVPQECTRDTSGLLYFDLLSSKMYRCSGREWQEWGWGTAGGDGFQYTALLKDAAASSSASSEQSPGVDDDADEPAPDNENDDVDIETTTASNQAYGKKRKAQCGAGQQQSLTISVFCHFCFLYCRPQ